LSVVPLSGKEDTAMLLEESTPARSASTIWKNCIFALVLGLLVCISDIRLPGDVLHAEDFKAAETGAPVAAMADGPGVDADDLRFVDVTTAAAVDPQGEPELLPFDRIIHEAAGRYGLDAYLIAAVIMAESQFNPSALSKKGAKGLMQIMPVTANALDMTNVYCPEENIDAGSRHLKWLLERFDGNVRLALAAYNAGLQNVITYKGVPPYPETQAYIVKVMGHYSAIRKSSVAF
jgi:soluble lytic murein transglycosylase-like protein